MKRNGKLLRYGTQKRVGRTGEWRYNAPRIGRDELARTSDERYMQAINRKFAAMMEQAMRGRE